MSVRSVKKYSCSKEEFIAKIRLLESKLKPDGKMFSKHSNWSSLTDGEVTKWIIEQVEIDNLYIAQNVMRDCNLIWRELHERKDSSTH